MHALVRLTSEDAAHPSQQSATRRTPRGASRWVHAMPAWSVKNRRASPRHSRKARVYPAVSRLRHEMSTHPPPSPLVLCSSFPCPPLFFPAVFAFRGLVLRPMITTAYSRRVPSLCGKTRITSRQGRHHFVAQDITALPRPHIFLLHVRSLYPAPAFPYCFTGMLNAL